MLPLWGTINCQAVSIAVTCPGSTSIAVGFHFEQHNYIKKRLLGLWGTTCWVCLQELIAMLTWPKRIPVAWKVIVLAICCDLFGMIKGHFKWLSDLQLGPGDRKVTLNHLGLVSLLLHKKNEAFYFDKRDRAILQGGPLPVVNGVIIPISRVALRKKITDFLKMHRPPWGYRTYRKKLKCFSSVAA